MFKLKSILVPTDFSDFSLEALDTALELAAQFGADISMVYVVEDSGLRGPGAEYALSLESFREKLAHEADEQFKKILARYDGTKIATYIRYGDSPREIVEFAERMGADMIVIATHGRSGMARLFMGSTTEHVVRSARCPVLTVRRQRTPAAAAK